MHFAFQKQNQKLVHRSRGSPSIFWKSSYQCLLYYSPLQIYVLSSSIKKGEIERAFPSQSILMLNDNTKDYTNSIVKVVSELISSALSQDSGSTAPQGAVVPLRRYHRHHYRASTESQAPKNRSSTTAALYRLSGSAAGLRAVVPLMRYHKTGSTTIMRTFAPKIFSGFRRPRNC